MLGPSDDHGPQDDVVPLHQPFEIALRGFNRQQVLDHIESLEGQISLIGTDRDAALAQVAELSRLLEHLRKESEVLDHLRRETQRASAEVERMQRSPIVAASARIQGIVRLAEEEAAEITAKARQEAADLTSRAQRAAADERARADREITERRNRANAEAETLLRQTTRRCKELEAESDRRCRDAEQRSAKEIAEREAKAEARIAERERRSTIGLGVALRFAGRELAARVRDVEAGETALVELRERTEREVATLDGVRAEIADRLSSTHSILAEALEHVEPPATTDGGSRPVPVQRDRTPDADDTAVAARPMRLVSSAPAEDHR